MGISIFPLFTKADDVEKLLQNVCLKAEENKNTHTNTNTKQLTPQKETGDCAAAETEEETEKETENETGGDRQGDRGGHKRRRNGRHKGRPAMRTPCVLIS